MAVTARWERPSSRIAGLLRAGAELVQAAPEELIAEIDAATLGGLPREVAEDPILAAAVRRINRTNLYAWARANVSEPGCEVPASLGSEGLGLARDLVRRGLDDQALQAYRMGQNVAWRKWMEIAFTLTDDAEELRDLLDISARSIFGFVDTTLRHLADQIRAERDELTRGTHAERLEFVSLIINGVRVSRERAATRLGYELEQDHTAAIVWSDEPEPASKALGQVADAIVRDAGALRPLVVIASAGALWVWIPSCAGVEVESLEAAVDGHPKVRVAVGPTAAGIDGFRRSHLNAMATQRLMMRAPSQPQVATYDAIELVALLTHDEEGYSQFVKRTLGELEAASPELRETVRVYLAEQSSAQRAATRLFTHRNTVLNRVARADAMLPRPLSDNSLAV
ncbi:MAG: PucR family transcriptional regulator, partial [Conexibacteraceae bacterium]|nr:PucR family transcriptional regulator [Conexibacteraceae bacterium]